MSNNIRSLLPSSDDRDDRAADWKFKFITDAVIKVLANIRKTSADEVRREVRSPSTPLKASDYPGNSVVKILTLAPGSTMAQLAPLGTTVDLKGVSTFSFPLPTNFSAAVFVGEGQPIPVRQGAYQGFTIGPVKALKLIEALSGELENATGGVASTVIGHTLEVMIGRGMDGQALSANPATADAPAGLLNGVTPITPTAGGGTNAMVADLRNLISSFSAAFVDTSSVVLVCAPSQAISLSLLAGPHFTHRIIESAALAAGTIIACATAGLVVAGSGTPTIDTSKQASVHMADPASQLASGGTMAAPTSSMFQQDLLALKCTAFVTWAAAPGSIAVINGCTW